MTSLDPFVSISPFLLLDSIGIKVCRLEHVLHSIQGGRIRGHPNSERRNLYVPSKGTRTIRECFLDDRVEMEQNEEAPVPISRFTSRRDFIIGSRSSLSSGSTVGKLHETIAKERVRFSILLPSYTTYKCLTSPLRVADGFGKHLPPFFVSCCCLARKEHLLLRCSFEIVQRNGRWKALTKA